MADGAPATASSSVTALLARLPRPAARLSYDLQAKDLALTLTTATSASAVSPFKPEGAAVKTAASVSTATGQLSVRCSATKRLLLSDPHAAQPGTQPLTADVKVRATSGLASSLSLCVSSKRRVRLSNGSALELKGGAVLDSQRMEATPTGHIRWRSALWSVSSCQDLGLLVGLDYPPASRDLQTALAAAGGVQGLLQAAGNTARTHWPAGPPPLLPLLLLPLHLLQRLKRARRRRQLKGKSSTSADGSSSRRVRFTDEAVVVGDSMQDPSTAADGAAGADGAPAGSKPAKRRSRKGESSGTAAAEGPIDAEPSSRSKRSSRSGSSSAEGKEQPSAPKSSPTRRSRQSPADGERRKGKRPLKPEPEQQPQPQQQQQQQQRRGVPQWMKRLVPKLPRRLRQKAGAFGRRVGDVAGRAGRVLGKVAAVSQSVMGDLHVELTQLQYLPGSYTPNEHMRLRYKHGQLRLLYDL